MCAWLHKVIPLLVHTPHRVPERHPRRRSAVDTLPQLLGPSQRLVDGRRRRRAVDEGRRLAVTAVVGREAERAVAAAGAGRVVGGSGAEVVHGVAVYGRERRRRAVPYVQHIVV